jgi:hypothetical protein
MNRICLSLSLAFALLAAVESQTAKASPLDAKAMKVALHTATPEEEGFIDKALALIDRGILPLDLVESTFLWAKKKPRNKFQYFKYGLKLRAEREGIPL